MSNTLAQSFAIRGDFSVIAGATWPTYSAEYVRRRYAPVADFRIGSEVAKTLAPRKRTERRVRSVSYAERLAYALVAAAGDAVPCYENSPRYAALMEEVKIGFDLWDRQRKHEQAEAIAPSPREVEGGSWVAELMAEAADRDMAEAMETEI